MCQTSVLQSTQRLLKPVEHEMLFIHVACPTETEMEMRFVQNIMELSQLPLDFEYITMQSSVRQNQVHVYQSVQG